MIQTVVRLFVLRGVTDGSDGLNHLHSEAKNDVLKLKRQTVRLVDSSEGLSRPEAGGGGGVETCEARRRQRGAYSSVGVGSWTKQKQSSTKIFRP